MAVYHSKNPLFLVLSAILFAFLALLYALVPGTWDSYKIILDPERFSPMNQGLSLPPSQLAVPDDNKHSYDVQIFSRDPLILYIENFVTQDEIQHLLELRHQFLLAEVGQQSLISDGSDPDSCLNSEKNWFQSMIYPGNQAYVDTSKRASDTAEIDRDEVVRRIERRARRLQGWRGRGTELQPLRTQRYGVGGFYTFHYDWDSLSEHGNRVTTFMVYLVADCSGGGTNFPRLERPSDGRWCNVIECEDDEYVGVTFKPIAGAAVFWENMYPNGTLHPAVRHAALPVKSGKKIGLNIWFWDSEWRKPVETGTNGQGPL
ncbi:Prolyl 4-hydroxylase subunit alpha-1 [Cladobotryum mycophilum]|uniref:Prolyl 4-hydroxylase subunit alpha-1 n=1 Tax=Cladobotryum mycophilum TaxID=491253 RepID=A0ABR0SVK1_9HYPO